MIRRLPRALILLALLAGFPMKAPVAAAEQDGSAFGRSTEMPMVRVERIRLRDGVELVGDLFLPAGGRQAGTIVEITPYERQSRWSYRGDHGFWTAAGFALLVVDARGRGDSGGTFSFLRNEGRDGFDVVEWVAQQPWSNGRVGMIGGSYTGTNQWFVAREKPPHLACINPNSTLARPRHELPYQQGAFRADWALSWPMVTNPNRKPIDFDLLLKHRPLATADRALGMDIPEFRTFLSNPPTSAYWDALELSDADYAAITIPTFSISGWFDGTLAGTVHHARKAQAHSPEPSRHLLMIGPWDHDTARRGGYGRSDGQPRFLYGDLSFPPNSVVPATQMVEQFFRACLADGRPLSAAPVRLYITGRNQWVEAASFPVPGIRATPLYLASQGAANGVSGGGLLSFEKPKSRTVDTFRFDPLNPVSSMVGGKPLMGNPVDIGALQDDPRLLVYTTPPLKEPLTILGNVKVVLFASSSARDTDFTARIQDVGPDGRVINLASKGLGVVRARYRNGGAREELLVPGRIERFEIDLFELGHSFLPGHRLRIDVSSSGYPWVHPNTNSGNDIPTDTGPPVTAVQTVHVGANHASHILLPVVDPDALRQPVMAPDGDTRKPL
jgi:putative CocE/NonD family hydrolase